MLPLWLYTIETVDPKKSDSPPGICCWERRRGRQQEEELASWRLAPKDSLRPGSHGRQNTPCCHLNLTLLSGIMKTDMGEDWILFCASSQWGHIEEFSLTLSLPPSLPLSLSPSSSPSFSSLCVLPSPHLWDLNYHQPNLLPANPSLYHTSSLSSVYFDIYLVHLPQTPYLWLHPLLFHWVWVMTSLWQSVHLEPHGALAANLTSLSTLCPTVIWPTLIGTRVLPAGAGGVLVLVTVPQISKQQSSGAWGTAKGCSFYVLC